jgi:cation:H+ antiporter
MTLTIFLSLAGGLVLLVLGGELLVRGAVRLAERLGMSPLLIGLTLVGFGTSTPELVTSVQAALAGSPGIAVGNIVGSNIANILLILGLAAILSPISVGSNALKRDGSLVVLTALALTAVGFLAQLDRLTGIVFVLGLAGYVIYAYLQESRAARSGSADHTAAFEKGQALEEAVPHLNEGHARSLFADAAIALTMCLAGLVLVVIGGSYIVDGAIQLARAFNISETVIGLTIVAVGTSTPELVTSIIAAIRKHSDVALGNILGSNIYNILGIGGLTGIISPTAIPQEIASFDNLVMVAVSLALVAIMYSGRTITRMEGGLLILGYVVYLAVLWPK